LVESMNYGIVYGARVNYLNFCGQYVVIAEIVEKESIFEFFL
jgi:hypothetical protein